MKTIKTSDLIGPALDWAVAKCEFASHVVRFQRGPVATGYIEEVPRFSWVTRQYTRCKLARAKHLFDFQTGDEYSPSTNWAQGGPIIERGKIALTHGSPVDTGFGWFGHLPHVGPGTVMKGPTPLIAAMRCRVASKLGDTVDVPEELL